MNFETQFHQLVKETLTNVSNLDKIAQTFVEQSDYSPAKWTQGIAICTVAVDEGKVTPAIEELFRQLFRQSRNNRASSELDDANYAKWFEISKQLCNKMIAAGVKRAYAEMADIYEHARLPFHSFDIANQYLKQGIEIKDMASMCIYGHSLFLGRNNVVKDEVLGRKLIEEAAKMGYEWGELNLIMLDFDEPNLNYSYLDRLQKYVENDKEGTSYNVLGDYYSHKLNDPEQAFAIYTKGAEIGSDHCKYHLAVATFNGRETLYSEEKALEVLIELSLNRVLYATTFLGQVYQYSENFKSIEKAIYWFQFAEKYEYPNAYLHLALLYLYQEEIKDYEKAKYYLDKAIALDVAKAYIEKGYHLMDVKEFGINKTEGIALLEKATEMGDSYSPYRLGNVYQFGEVGPADLAKALELYELSASRDCVEAMELSGRFYRIGIGCEPDYEKAIEYLSKAIEFNSNYARVELAVCYEQGTGVEQNYETSFDLLSKATENNYTFAAIKLAYYYLNGVFVSIDVDKAFELFTIGAEAGFGEAYYNLGRMYKYAIGRSQNPSLAVEFFEKGAIENDIDANIEMGLAYEHAFGGLEFDAKKASEYMSLAAEAGSSYAEYKVGYYYYYGVYELDRPKGLEWLSKACENQSPYAAVVLGDHFLYGRDGEPDYTKAFEYYSRAMQAGYISEGMGLCYQFGLGVEENETEAFKYYGLATEQGHSQAKYRLGMCHYRGIGTEINVKEAYVYLLEAANEEITNAQYQLGLILINGQDIEQDEATGIKYLSLAAEDDHDEAQLELGNCYLMGKGVDIDEVKAMFWYQKAADNGNEQAQKLTGKRKRNR